MDCTNGEPKCRTNSLTTNACFQVGLEMVPDLSDVVVEVDPLDAHHLDVDAAHDAPAVYVTENELGAIHLVYLVRVH